MFDEKVLWNYGRTDGRTDGMMDRYKPVYPPLFQSGDIITGLTAHPNNYSNSDIPWKLCTSKTASL